MNVLISDQANLFVHFNPSRQNRYDVTHRTCVEYSQTYLPQGNGDNENMSSSDNTLFAGNDDLNDLLAGCLFPMRWYLSKFYTLHELRNSF